jgi:hypothetical protein
MEGMAEISNVVVRAEFAEKLDEWTDENGIVQQIYSLEPGEVWRGKAAVGRFFVLIEPLRPARLKEDSVVFLRRIGALLPNEKTLSARQAKYGELYELATSFSSLMPIRGATTVEGNEVRYLTKADEARDGGPGRGKGMPSLPLAAVRAAVQAVPSRQP